MAEHPEQVVTGSGLSFQTKQEQFLEKNRMTLAEQIQQAIKLSSQKRIPIEAARQEIVKFQKRVDFEDRLRLKIEEMGASKAEPLSFDAREKRINAALEELNIPIPGTSPKEQPVAPAPRPADFIGTPRERITEDRPRIRLA